MNRINFIKAIFTGGAIALVKPQLLANNEIKKEFSFDELFIVHDGNDILIYPKKDSEFYKKVQSSFIEKLDPTKICIYMGVHELSIPVKDKYTWEDFLPIKYYFECVYSDWQKYTIEGYGVSFRFIKDKPDRMHLDVFTCN